MVHYLKFYWKGEGGKQERKEGGRRVGGGVRGVRTNPPLKINNGGGKTFK